MVLVTEITTASSHLALKLH